MERLPPSKRRRRRVVGARAEGCRALKSLRWWTAEGATAVGGAGREPAGGPASDGCRAHS